MRYLTVCLLFVGSTLFAQQIRPKGQFLADSIKIGEPVGFSLALKYPKELDIVFPDSLFDFSPYELESKTYLPTVSNDSVSYDSAVYFLTTFEIDTVQYLKLPVFVLHGRDSSLVYTNADSIILKQLVEEIPDSVSAEAAPLIENTDYIQVPLQFNYPYFIIGAVILVIIMVLVIILFGKKIRNIFRLRRLTRAHKKFITSYEELIGKHNQPQSQHAESILLFWKKYLEKLERRPYTKLTTREIMTRYKPEQLHTSLSAIDRVIYAGIHESKLEDSYDILKQFAEDQYQRKIEEVKNG